MRVAFFGNNRLGARVAAWLAEQGEEIAALVLHPPDRRRFGDELRAAAPTAPVLDATRLDEPAELERLAATAPDLGVSVLFGYLLRPPVLTRLPRGCVNLHPGLLPYNRGAFPNVWPILDGTPAGTSLHWIDEAVDTGDLIAQREVAVEPVDTGETLYRKLEDASFDLFCATWPALRDGTAPRSPQPAGAGSVHRVGDVAEIDEIDVDASYRAGELIDLIRARTFSGFPGAYVVRDGRRIGVRIALEYLDG